MFIHTKFRTKSTGSKQYYLKKIDGDIYRKIQLFSTKGYYIDHQHLELITTSRSPQKYYESHHNKTHRMGIFNFFMNVSNILGARLKI